MHCYAQTNLVSTAPLFMTSPPHLDHTVTGIFTFIAGDYNVPMEQYGHTAYIHLRHSSEEELEHFPSMDIM